MLERILARDAEYDALFITGVSTTGIYCLPSCGARKPKPENVEFFSTPADARRAGLRACKRCSPDEHLAGRPPELELAKSIGNAVRNQPNRYPTVASMAESFGISTTRCVELMRKYYHSTPTDRLQRARVDQAKQRLLASQNPIVDISGEVGFESLSSFNSQFLRRCFLTPSEFRRIPDGAAFSLRLPEDYPTEYILSFLGRHPQSPTEKVSDRSLERALVWNDASARLIVRIKDGHALCHLSDVQQASPQLFIQGYRVAAKLLGLSTQLSGFRAHLQRLGPEVPTFPLSAPELRIPQTPSVFEGLVWSIVGQQVNLAFAYSLRQRLIELCGSTVGGDLLAHPTASQVARLSIDDLTALKFSTRKAEYLLGISLSIDNGQFAPEGLGDLTAPEAETILLSQRGLGPWATHYVMMRALNFGDCLPVGDTGLATALESAYKLHERPRGKEIIKLMKPFSPYRSLATTHLWYSLGSTAA